uniref:Uncharacterized protein n=1 Tax=Pseudictyota dubia TaxID=2749911 RepID=A0A7R9W4C9_9STRA
MNRTRSQTWTPPRSCPVFAESSLVPSISGTRFLVLAPRGGLHALRRLVFAFVVFVFDKMSLMDEDALCEEALWNDFAGKTKVTRTFAIGQYLAQNTLPSRQMVRLRSKRRSRRDNP